MLHSYEVAFGEVVEDRLRGGAVVFDGDGSGCGAGGAPVPSTTVCEPPAPTASADSPRSDAVRVSSGFFFAAIIPLSDV